MIFQDIIHININNDIKIGKCLSKAIIQNDEKIKLLEKLQWLCDDMSKGNLELIEIS